MLIAITNMAAKRKIKDDETEGYLHKVSPMKMAKKGRNAVFQEKTSFTELVCFAPDVQNKMTDLEKQK